MRSGRRRPTVSAVMPLCGPPLATLGILTFPGSRNNVRGVATAGLNEPVRSASSEPKDTTT